MSNRLDQLKNLYAADPNDPFITYGIALEHGKAGAFEEAVTWLDRTLELDEGYHYAYFQKGKMLSEIGEEDEAIAALETGIARAQADGEGKALGELSELLQSMREW